MDAARFFMAKGKKTKTHTHRMLIAISMEKGCCGQTIIWAKFLLSISFPLTQVTLSLLLSFLLKPDGEWKRCREGKTFLFDSLEWTLLVARSFAH